MFFHGADGHGDPRDDNGGAHPGNQGGDRDNDPKVHDANAHDGDNQDADNDCDDVAQDADSDGAGYVDVHDYSEKF